MATNNVGNSTVIETANAVARIEAREYVRATDAADRMEKNVQALQNVVKTLEGDVYMVVYDIPDSLKDEAPNPSRDFWKHGFRLNLSCWVMPEKGLNSARVQAHLNHWASIPQREERVHPNLPYTRMVGVKVYTIKYHEDQVGVIREIAKEMVRQELIRVHTALIERIEAADRRMREAEAVLNFVGPMQQGALEKERAAIITRNAGDSRKNLRDAIEAFEGALDACRIFDETEDLKVLFAGVRGAIRAEALAFNAQMELIGRRGVSVPACIAQGDVLATSAAA